MMLRQRNLLTGIRKRILNIYIAHRKFIMFLLRCTQPLYVLPLSNFSRITRRCDLYVVIINYAIL